MRKYRLLFGNCTRTFSSILYQVLQTIRQKKVESAPTMRLLILLIVLFALSRSLHTILLFDVMDYLPLRVGSLRG